jgi:peroxiredoxin Q/BCP
MLTPEQPAPDFEAPSSKGTNLRLSSYRGKSVILYFFPKAFTSGCEMETREFGRLYPQLTAKGVEVIGVSVDEAPTQTAFAEECEAAFPLVADTSKEVARSYGVLGITGSAKRVTFFIDPTGKVVDVVEALRPGPHTDRAVHRFLGDTPA